MWLISDPGEVSTQYIVCDLLWETCGEAESAGNAWEDLEQVDFGQYIDSFSLNAILRQEKCWEGLKIPLKMKSQNMTLKHVQL